MKATEHEKETAITSVQVRKATHRRLRDYRKTLRLRPSLLDLATVAIEEYIDRAEAPPRDAA